MNMIEKGLKYNGNERAR